MGDPTLNSVCLVAMVMEILSFSGAFAVDGFDCDREREHTSSTQAMLSKKREIFMMLSFQSPIDID
jgi:hypothetical protein